MTKRQISDIIELDSILPEVTLSTEQDHEFIDELTDLIVAMGRENAREIEARNAKLNISPEETKKEADKVLQKYYKYAYFILNTCAKKFKFSYFKFCSIKSVFVRVEALKDGVVIDLKRKNNSRYDADKAGIVISVRGSNKFKTGKNQTSSMNVEVAMGDVNDQVKKITFATNSAQISGYFRPNWEKKDGYRGEVKKQLDQYDQYGLYTEGTSLEDAAMVHGLDADLLVEKINAFLNA